ncbi:DUF4040 domain-containing protein [Calothrix rhizosoleniae]|uniref:DUF4040 domain-containing protein n=1 Tax=Calothrix rhizosoleniae TaxID=888997 RepID=UPI000B4A2A0E|nr:DUF4040 domain-containing protein [Calothrix rhizosoleniae]
MTEDLYIVVITALLPLTACTLVLQVNPYHALVIRGILGAVAALVYALFGAADVALTEALVGTMLSITLYAVAVRSSLRMRLGVLENEPNGNAKPPEQLVSSLRKTLSKYHMGLEVLTYTSIQALQTALVTKEIHTMYVSSEQWIPWNSPQSLPLDEQPLNHIQTRIQRLYEIMQKELSPDLVNLTYIQPSSISQSNNHGKSDSVEVQK